MNFRCACKVSIHIVECIFHVRTVIQSLSSHFWGFSRKCVFRHCKTQHSISSLKNFFFDEIVFYDIAKISFGFLSVGKNCWRQKTKKKQLISSHDRKRSSFHSPSHSSSFCRIARDQSRVLCVLFFLQMLKNMCEREVKLDHGGKIKVIAAINLSTYTINRLLSTSSGSFSSSVRSIHSSLASLALRSLGGVKLWPTIVP